jgi:uncharacterized repeat protein (TIGR01451 family)
MRCGPMLHHKSDAGVLGSPCTGPEAAAPPRCRFIVACAALLIISGAVTSAADTVVVFGPQTYRRSAGSPVTVRSTFSTQINPSASYFLRIERAPGASADISLNGKVIVRASEFNGDVTSIERPITLLPSNEVAVRLVGKPGSTVIVRIVAVRDTPARWSVTKTHAGSFTQGQQKATYTVTVSNAMNAGTTAGTVTVAETVPTGLALVSMSGSGWQCVATTCTRGDALVGGASYPPVTVTVNVAATATSPQVNEVAVSGGGSAAATATDATTIVANPPVLTITKAHSGNFTQGQQNATYTVTVSNAINAGTTTGTVAVAETVPTGLALVSMAGDGWQCVATTCTRGDALVGGASYPPVTVTVNVAATATSPQVNEVAVSGGGSAAASATDPTTIVANSPVLSITKTHTGNFTQGQQGAAYLVTVSNAPNAGPTSGSVTVSDTVPTGLTLVSMAGAGWQCTDNSCTRSDGLAGGSSYPQITVTVNVAAAATSPQVNAVTVAGGGSASADTVDSTTIVPVVPTDETPPSFSINSPAPGAFVFQNRPPIDVFYSDPSGVDTASLAFTANGSPLGVDCALGAAGGRCAPISPLPEGAVILGASVRDSVGNQATAGVSFTVDSTSLDVQITSPANRLITTADSISVSGTVGAGVTTLTVNDVAAALTGNAFNATVPLRAGINMIVAVGTKANGKTGTDSIDVTRDTIAPIVRIDSPSDGFVSANNAIPITGLVNDIVNGGLNATVSVNGVSAAVGDGTFMVTTIPLVRGPNTIRAIARDFAGNQGEHSITVRYEPPVGARVAILSGNGQAAEVKQPLPQAFVAIVKDDVGNPLAGRVVTFQVSRNNGLLRLAPGDAGQRSVQIPTDGSGRASVLLRLGDTAGQGNNRVLVSALGVTGEVEFCASGLTAPPQKILMTMGDNQRGAVGQPLATPMEALVADRDGNPVKDLDVSFSIARGGGNIDGAQTAVRRTGVDGIARAVLTLGPDPGISNNVVTAIFEGLTTLPATFVASALVPGDPAQTTFKGVVMDNGLTAIPGATVRIDNTAVQGVTDEQGQFLLQNVPVGKIHLIIDPANSPRPETFPPLAFETITIAGQVNVLGQPILIPALDTEGSRIVGGPEDVVLKMPGVAGLELTVFKNSVTCRDGSHQCRVTISQVHLDKVPMPPPSGTIFMPPAWTVQPAGTHFNPPARISIPNDGMPPGRQIDIFQFDHDLNQFVNIGKGTTREDGLVIVSDPGFGITAAGWGGCGQPQPPTTCAGSCDDANRCTGDGCQNGSCVHTPKTEPQTKAGGCKGCDNGAPKEPQTNAQCCATGAANDPANTAGGYVVCCNGGQAACVGSGFNGSGKGPDILRQCANAHEVEHFKHTECPTGADECKTTGPLGPKPGQDRGQAECDSSKVEVACLQTANCGTDAACQASVAARIVQIRQYGNTNKAGCFP